MFEVLFRFYQESKPSPLASREDKRFGKISKWPLASFTKRDVLRRAEEMVKA